MATVFAPVGEVSPAEFARATDVTYLGYVYGTMAALRRMGCGRGTIVQVGSALAYRAIPLQSAYCGAKFAVRGFTDSVRTELMHDRSWEMTALVDDDDDQHEPSTVAPTARRSRRPLQQTTETIKEDTSERSDS